MINSKAKGKRGELEFCRLAKENGYAVRRTAQYCGNTGEAADVVGLNGLHCEIKRTERLDIRAAMAQSVRDSEVEGRGNIPILAHKKNNTEWLITLRANDFFAIYREWEAGRDGENVR